MTGSEAIAFIRGHEKYETLSRNLELEKEFRAHREEELQDFIDNNSHLFGDMTLSMDSVLCASVAFDVHRKQKAENEQIRQDMKRGLLYMIESAMKGQEKEQPK